MLIEINLFILIFVNFDIIKMVKTIDEIKRVAWKMVQAMQNERIRKPVLICKLGFLNFLNILSLSQIINKKLKKKMINFNCWDFD